jgi:exodeoxyribonuclease-5
MTTLTRASLSTDQAEAYDAILAWCDSRGTPTLTMGGFAGVGKTTVLAIFAKEASVSPLAFVAFTGKAASVLGRKMKAAGVDTTNKLVMAKDRDTAFTGKPYCGTIHSLIYRPCSCMEPRTKDQPPVERPCTICREKRYMRRQSLDRDYNLIVVDEASMVSDDMLSDLLSFGVPILAVGDHGQLPPVKGTGSLMRAPQIRLERIHRQAEGNPIIALSKAIRETGDFDTRFDDGISVRFGSLRNLKEEIRKHFAASDNDGNDLFNRALICYTNKRRVGLNQLARQTLGLKGPPTRLEQVICLRNMRSVGVYNGMRGRLVAPAEQLKPQQPWLYTASIEFPDEGLKAQEFNMCGAQFNREKTFNDIDNAREETGIEAYSWEGLGALFDFGYAMTCHKVQGSGFSDVVVLAETYGMPLDTAQRWKYTAVTRASERVVILR